MLTARIAGCVFSVSVSRSSGPSKHSRLSGSPSAASASAKVSRHTGNASASAWPMPTFCDPCPGKMNAITDGYRHAAAMSCSTRCDESGWPRTGRPCATALRTALAIERPWPTTTDAGDAEQRRAAVLGVVDAPAEAAERAPRQQRAHLPGERARSSSPSSASTVSTSPSLSSARCCR